MLQADYEKPPALAAFLRARMDLESLEAEFGWMPEKGERILELCIRYASTSWKPSLKTQISLP